MGTLQSAISAYQQRCAIECMFRDCKTGGYNLEGCHTIEARLSAIVLIIAIAYTSAVIQGIDIRTSKVEPYICRPKESHRIQRRHSNFWVGLYGKSWLNNLQLCIDWVGQWMRINRCGATLLSARFERYRLDAACVLAFCHPISRNNLSLALPRIAQEFGWSDREVGSKGELLLAAFFLSYALSNMLLSPLAERFGAKRSVMVAIGAFSVITMLSAPLGYSFTAMIVLRLLLGLGEGVHIPMLSAIISHWFLPGERCRQERLAP